MELIYATAPCQVLFWQCARRIPLRVNNVARRLQLPERTVRHLALTNRIPAFKIDGKSWGFWPEDVELYRLCLEAHRAEYC
jgi:hypothetical protein